MTINVKELKQALAQKKENRVIKMIQLGEKAHQKMLLNTLQDAELANESTEILTLDKEIYTLSKQLLEASQNKEKCIKCQNSITTDVKFCGFCGQLNSFYVDLTVQKKQCAACETHIDEQMQYCPCCGTKQGGM